MKRVFKLIETNRLEVVILKNDNPIPQVNIPFIALVKSKAGLKTEPFWLWQKRPSKRPLKICSENYHIIPLDRAEEEVLLKKGISPRYLYWIGSFIHQNKSLIINFWQGGDIIKIEPRIQRSCSCKSYYPEYMPLGDYFVRIQNDRCSLVVLKQSKLKEMLSNEEVSFLQILLSLNNIKGKLSK